MNGRAVANHYNARVRLHASAPTRLDLAGGTLDIWPLYLFHEGAQTLNAAITLRAECTLSTSDDNGIYVVSEDTGLSLRADHWSALSRREEPRLVTRILRFFEAERLRVVTKSAAPMGAGLAGSSALNIALCGAMSRWQERSYTSEELIALALNLEAEVLGVPTGAQDYRPAMYGGLAAVKLSPTGVRRETLALDPRELESRIVLTYTGESRDSGINNWEITKRHLDGDQEVIELFGQLRDVAIMMRQALEDQDWSEVGRQLATEWALRKRLAPGVSTPTIDMLVERGCAAGAAAAKVCGAGGGGCVLFLADPSVTAAVRETVSTAGAQVLDVRVDNDGLRFRTD